MNSNYESIYKKLPDNIYLLGVPNILSDEPDPGRLCAVGDDEVALLFACGDSKFKSELNEFSWHSLVSESESNTILRGLQSDIF